MADTATNLGQSAPAATTEDDIYTAANPTTVSSVIVCNRGSVDTTFRIGVRAAAGASQNQDWLYYDHPLPANRTFIATIGQMLSAGNILRVFAGNANVSFNASGIVST